MRKYGLFFMISILLITLAGCNELATSDDLIGGKWLVTNGYEDGEIGGDPVCPSFDKGLEFIDEEKEFVYKLSESDEGMSVIFLIQVEKLTFLKLLWKTKMHLALMAQG